MPDTELSRISKLFVDRDEMTTHHALARRQTFAVVMVCGADVAHSRILQLAVLTAINLANRCFPAAVRVALDDRVLSAPLLAWPTRSSTFGQAVSNMVGREALIARQHLHDQQRAIIFGDAVGNKNALRATFDGWVASVGPAHLVDRLQERGYCSLAGVLAAAIAVSELFLSFAEINVESGRRRVALSLWRPDADVDDPLALGVPVEFLPKDLWVLGLGHLGNAYLWSLASLPYKRPQDVEIVLNDFDRVGTENIETSVLLGRDQIGRFKTRACATWMEDRGFKTRIVERPFDEHFRCRADEPQLAICGFDSNLARRSLETAHFRHVIESGLGGDVHNFDAIGLHTLPNVRSAAALWPDVSEAERDAQNASRELRARESAAYVQMATDECGRIELAGRSIAIPFVGVAASCLVLAEALRMFHDGAAYTDLRLRLATPAERSSHTVRSYSVQDLAGITYLESAG